MIRIRPSLLSRHLNTLPRHLSSLPLRPAEPAPPKLPKEEQKIFDQLQRESTGAFSTPSHSNSNPNSSSPSRSSNTSSPALSSTSPNRVPQINQSPDSSPPPSSSDPGKAVTDSVAADGDQLHPHVRRGAPPEFEGDVNPRTGEVGGPKTEPLRWGGGVDWSYNGRVTDF